MGNCLRSTDKAVERAGGVDEEVKKITGKLTPSNLEEIKRRVVRVKVVVTRQELEQIMKCSKKGGDYLKESSVEKLVTAMKLRGRRVFEVGTDDYVGAAEAIGGLLWRAFLRIID